MNPASLHHWRGLGLWVPDLPFQIFKPIDQEIGDLFTVQECRTTDFEAPKLGKVPSGYVL